MTLIKALCLILLLALGTPPACSHFTERGRQKRVYAKHLKKKKIARERRKARLHGKVRKSPPPELMTPSEPREVTPMAESPRAVPSDPNNQ